MTFFPFPDEFQLLLVGGFLGKRVIACCRTAEEDEGLEQEEAKKTYKNNHVNTLPLFK